MLPATPSPPPAAGTNTASPVRASKRLMKELAHLQKDPPPNVAAWPVKENLHKLHAQLCGPTDSPYEGGLFRVELNIPDTYPLDPPSATFLTPLYHPNVDERGRICLDTLSLPPKGCWSPALTLASLLTTIHQLLAYPNGQDGLVREVADVYNTDRHAFDARAREWCRRHAMGGKGEGDGGVGGDKGVGDVGAVAAETAGLQAVMASEASESGKRQRDEEGAGVAVGAAADGVGSEVKAGGDGVPDGDELPPDVKKRRAE